MNLGLTIAESRKRNKMTQNELAQKSGLSRSFICDIENGRYNPSLKTLIKIGEILQMSFFSPSMTEIHNNKLD